MLVRDTVLEDLPGVVRARQEAWKATYRGIIPDAVLDGLDFKRDMQTWQARLASLGPDQFLFTAEIDGAAIGFCMGGPCRDADPEYDGELFAIYVLPAHHRQGAGQALFQAAADWLRQSGFRRMLIWALAENHGARRFYERMGAAPVRQRLIQIGGADLPEVGYGLDLCRE